MIYTGQKLLRLVKPKKNSKPLVWVIKLDSFRCVPWSCQSEYGHRWLCQNLADAKTDEVLGIHIIGARAADLIAQAVTAMEFRASAEDIARMSHAHPTYAEAMKEAALAATETARYTSRQLIFRSICKFLAYGAEFKLPMLPLWVCFAILGGTNSPC